MKAHASALNRVDLEQRQRNYPPPIRSQSEIPGLDAKVVEKRRDNLMLSGQVVNVPSLTTCNRG